MGCGGSKEEGQSRRASDGKYKHGTKKSNNGGEPASGEATPSALRPAPDADLEDDPGRHSPLARKESAAVNASEPGDFVAKMKTAYQVRKAKFNGANEDVDQYADEIKDSIPALARRDRARIQEWVNDVSAANPGDVFEDIPADGKQRRSSAVTASSDGNYRQGAGNDNASDKSCQQQVPADPGTPLGKQSSSIAAVRSETTNPGLFSDDGSPMKRHITDSGAQQGGDHALPPGEVPCQEEAHGGNTTVPLVQVTSGSTNQQPHAQNGRRGSHARQSTGDCFTATPSGLDVSDGPSANPEDATQSQGVATDESDVVEGGDFKFN